MPRVMSTAALIEANRPGSSIGAWWVVSISAALPNMPAVNNPRTHEPAEDTVATSHLSGVESWTRTSVRPLRSSACPWRTCALLATAAPRARSLSHAAVQATT